MHRLIYLIGIGGTGHFLWLVKSDLREPLIYGFSVALLLGFRVWGKYFRGQRAMVADTAR